MSEIGEKLINELGKEAFIASTGNDEEPVLFRNEARKLVIVLLRETIGPFVVRSDVPEETISLNIGERNVVEVPARKFKSREKMNGIKFLRLINKMPKGYIYNEVSERSQLRNPTSILMGDTIVKGIDAGKSMIPSRVLYSHSYSIRDKFKITEILQHNQLGDFGTTIDSKGENKTGLFMTEYVKPGVFFPSFLTLQNPTAELLFHLLISLKASSYGAQTSITGSNIKNHIIGILRCKVEPPVTSYTIARDFELDKTGNIDRNVLTSFIIKEMIKKKVNEEDTFFIFDNEINRDIKESFSGTGGVKHLSLNTDALISRSSVEQVNELYEVLSKQIDQFFDKVFPEDDTKGKGSEKNAGKKSTK